MSRTRSLRSGPLSAYYHPFGNCTPEFSFGSVCRPEHFDEKHPVSGLPNPRLPRVDSRTSTTNSNNPMLPGGSPTRKQTVLQSTEEYEQPIVRLEPLSLLPLDWLNLRQRRLLQHQVRVKGRIPRRTFIPNF